MVLSSNASNVMLCSDKDKWLRMILSSNASYVILCSHKSIKINDFEWYWAVMHHCDAMLAQKHLDEWLRMTSSKNACLICDTILAVLKDEHDQRESVSCRRALSLVHLEMQHDPKCSFSVLDMRCGRLCLRVANKLSMALLVHCKEKAADLVCLLHIAIVPLQSIDSTEKKFSQMSLYVWYHMSWAVVI